MTPASAFLILAPDPVPGVSETDSETLRADLEAELAKVSHEQHRLAARKAVLHACLMDLRLGDEASLVWAKFESQNRRVDRTWPERR
jgi:hypothetical protein